MLGDAISMVIGIDARKFLKVMVIQSVAFGLLLSGCQTTQGKNSNKDFLSGVGAVAATAGCLFLTNKMNNAERAVTCAAVGAAGYFAGGAIGKYFDDRAKEIEKAAKENDAVVEQSAINVWDNPNKEKSTNNKNNEESKDQLAFKAIVHSNSHFDTGSSALTYNGKEFYSKTADAFSRDGKRSVVIIGHTDNEGDSKFNQQLSENRAKEVGKIFRSKGFDPNNIYYMGAGESEPVASNATAEGRSKNRRVEIVDAYSDRGIITSRSISRKEVKESYSASKSKDESIPKPPSNTYTLQSGPKVSGVDFGGVPASDDPWPQVFSDEAVKEKSFIGSIFSNPAHASELIPPFLNDELDSGGSIKRLADSKEIDYRPSDFLEGHGSKNPVYGQVGNHFIVAEPVGILDDYSVGPTARMFVFLNFSSSSNGKDADTEVGGIAKVYQGLHNALYRWHADKNHHGLIGMDILMPVPEEGSLPNGGFKEFKVYGKLYYQRNGKIFVQKMNLKTKLVKTKLDGGI